jgi:hypothetical protein
MRMTYQLISFDPLVIASFNIAILSALSCVATFAFGKLSRICGGAIQVRHADTTLQEV